MDSYRQDTTDTFWGEIAPCEHLVQLYEDDKVFLKALERFVAEGMKRDENVIVIATGSHLFDLENNMKKRGFDLHRSGNQYISIEAEEALRQFMIESWPDQLLFEKFVGGLLARCKQPRTRAFGEMVALLWARGESGATVRLEHLWNKVCQKEHLSLFCAYPKSGFTKDKEASVK
jgi:hypothetical protein